MDLNTRQLRYFLEVAKCLNFTRAALNLHIAQPALSQQILELEKTLEIKLFDRTSRSVSLTPAGKILMEETVQILQNTERLQRKLREAASGLIGSIRIGYLNEPYKQFLPRIIKRFNEKYPEVTVEIFQYNLGTLKDALQKGDIDIGFSLLFPDEATEHLGYSAAVIGTDDLCLAISEYRGCTGSAQTDFSYLSENNFLVLEDSVAPGWNEIVFNACMDLAIIPKTQIFVKQIESLILRIDSNLGFSFLPSSLKGYAKDLSVQFIPVRESCLRRAAIWNSTVSNASLPLFVDEVLGAVQPYDD